MSSERYVRIWDAEQGRAIRVHRMIAEQQLGRPLAPGEVVHHVNGDRSDNRPENLRVLPSQGHHMALEQLQRKVERGVEPLFGLEDLLSRGVCGSQDDCHIPQVLKSPINQNSRADPQL